MGIDWTSFALGAGIAFVISSGLMYLGFRYGRR